MSVIGWYTGTYVIVTPFERTTVMSQFGSEPVETTATVVQTGQRIEPGSCQRELRDAVFGTVLQPWDLDRPVKECVAAGIYPTTA